METIVFNKSVKHILIKMHMVAIFIFILDIKNEKWNIPPNVFNKIMPLLKKNRFKLYFKVIFMDYRLSIKSI